MSAILNELLNKEYKILKKISSINELHSWIKTEELLDKKNKFKYNKLKLLNFDSNFPVKKENRDLFLVFNKITSLKLSNNVKESLILKFLILYDEILSKEEILLFITSYWHITGSNWSDFYFFFSIWVKFLNIEILEIGEKSIELIWFQDAILNINLEKKIINFLLNLKEFLKLVILPYNLLTESIFYINKKPNKEQTTIDKLLTNKTLNLVINLFCISDSPLLENVYIEIISNLVDSRNLSNVDFFTNKIRMNIINWSLKSKKSLNRFLFFIQQIWQKRLITHSHFLEFINVIGNSISKNKKFSLFDGKNNLLANYIISLYHGSFLQLEQVLLLLNSDTLIYKKISNKTRANLFNIFESNSELFYDIKQMEFYLDLKKIYFFKKTHLNTFFQIIFDNPISWGNFVSVFVTRNKFRTKYFNLLLSFLKSENEKIKFSNIDEKFFRSLGKILDLASVIRVEPGAYFFFKKYFYIMEKDERYISFIPSLVLNFFNVFENEICRIEAVEKLLQILRGLNPLTINPSYYRMFLRDNYRLLIHHEIPIKIEKQLKIILDNFLEGYMHYSDFLIPSIEKIEFLSYLVTFEISDGTKNTILNWLKNQPNVNVKILEPNIKKNMAIQKEKFQMLHTNQVIKNDMKCGSCLREIINRQEQKSCDQCEIILCTTCFMEFEFSRENCPGTLFGSKTHKFLIKKDLQKKILS
jgi:hypothetical protein